jgi:hypothetical protein
MPEKTEIEQMKIVERSPEWHRPMLGAQSNKLDILAIDIQVKYQFVDSQKNLYHEYYLPTNPDIASCGGYVGKVIIYRDPKLKSFLSLNGISSDSFAHNDFPILRTRGPQLDLVLFALIRELKSETPSRQIALFDHGCTVGEHLDLLDVMLQSASCGEYSAASDLLYCGLDKSPFLLYIARSLHSSFDKESFKLVCKEGSDLGTWIAADLGFSVGVVNHVAEPCGTLSSLCRYSSIACVSWLWMTTLSKGFWATSHSGWPFYFFALADLQEIETVLGGKFFSLDYVPDSLSTQPESYIGLSKETFETLGSALLVFTRDGSLARKYGWRPLI